MGSKATARPRQLLPNSRPKAHLQSHAPVPRRPAELVAKFMDAELRAGAKGQSEEQLEATLDKALMLFRYIQVRADAALIARDAGLCVL